MSVKIRLKRMGKIRAPYYRVVVMDSRTKRDGRAIEEIGKYHPTEEPSLIEIDGERARYWLSMGAQPTESVAALLKVTGDWQKAKGLDGTDGTLKVKAEKTSKRDLYEAALAAAGTSDDRGSAPRKKAEKKADAPKEGAAPTDASVPAKDDGSAPEGYTVKGNKDSMKFHEPDGQWYDQTVAEVWFKTAADAQAAGYVKAGS